MRSFPEALFGIFYMLPLPIGAFPMVLSRTKVYTFYT